MKSNGITHNTIHDLPKKKLHSASKIQTEQYLLLRVLWKAEDAIEFTAKDWLDLESYKAAEKYLEQHDPWKKYWTSVKEQGMNRATLPAQGIGDFSIVHYQQSQISQVEETYYEGCDTPKISIHTTNVSRSPEASPLERKSRAQQPAQAERRYPTRATAPRSSLDNLSISEIPQLPEASRLEPKSRAQQPAQAERRYPTQATAPKSSLDNPFISEIPQLPEASRLERKSRAQQPAQAEHRYPTQATAPKSSLVKSLISKIRRSPKASRLEPKSRAQQPAQAKHRYPTRATAPRSSLDDPPTSKGSVKKMSQQFSNMTFDEGATTPSPFMRTPSFSTGHLSARSSLEAISPMDPALVKPASDEQIVNIALISFLNALTIFHEDVRAHWVIARKVFHLSDKFEARTDGLLKSDRNEYPLAILEVKSHVRKSNIKQVQMQESAQMASWIYDHPNKGYISRSSTGKMR